MGESRTVISSEHYFIGCLIKDYSFVINTCNTVGFKGEYLELPTAKAIWQTAEKLFAKGILVDSASIIETMEVESKHIDAESASSYLLKALSLANDPHNLVFHMKTVKERFRRRHTIDLLSEGVEMLADTGDVDDIVSRIKHRLSVMEQEMSYSSETDDDKKAAMTARYSKVRSLGTSGIKSRWSGLQNTLASYQFGKMIVVAARPKIGKSTFALNEATNTAYNNGIPTAFFSIEMDEAELLEKGASDLTEMDNAKLKLGEYSDKQIEHFISKGVDPLMKAPMFIIEQPAITIEQICSRTRQLVAEHGVKFVIIDYLQIISSTPGSRFQNRNYEIASWTNALRILAKETGVALVLLSQVSRPPKGFDANGDPFKMPMPTMNDLRDSGAIEQDAYSIICLGPSQVACAAPSWHGIVPVCIRVEANRGASTGDFECMFDRPHNKFMSFIDYEAHRKKVYAKVNASVVK